MSATLRPTLVLFAAFTILLGLVYPLATTGVIQVLFPTASQGSLIKGKDGTVLGSALIGQNFTKPEYFWGRLSATAPAYNGAASSGSNLGAANPTLAAAVQARIDALKAADPANTRPIPVDLVTASGSGLDPDISPAAAAYQIARVAHARNMPEATLAEMVRKHTKGRQWGIFGDPRINVLMLNLELDGKADAK